MTPEDEKDLKWEKVSTECLVQDEWIEFRRVAYRLPDGTIYSPFYNYSRRSYVVIVATDEEGNYLCVRQFRHGIEEVTTEFPAGGIEALGKGSAFLPQSAAERENALDAAKRELKEETGYISDEWQHLITVPSNATLADNYAYVFRARNCRKITGQHLDETEFLNVLKLREEDIEKLVKAGKFQQAIHIMAWLMAK